jgi:tRNA-2-methylthio-N6-dimethylallyladenosine synthase
VPHLDLICGPGELHELPRLLEEVRQGHRQLAALSGGRSRRTELRRGSAGLDALEALDLSRWPGVEGRVLQSYVRVQRGCDKFCTYCVVPYVRGPERSRPPGNIVAEVRRLAEFGCREVTLLGQTVNSYAAEEGGQLIGLAKLLERVHEVEGIDRIRFVTSYPADWDEDIFRVTRDYPRVMPYLHIPAQSGSDRILKTMRRTYTADSYIKLMDTARKHVPDIALAGDFIVGFCGETEEDFQQTVDLVRRVQYESLFIFKYSPRPGTKADRLADDDVPQEVKVRRNNELLAIQNEISQLRKQALIGQEVEVLVEGPSKAARKAGGETGSEQRTRGKCSASLSRKRTAGAAPNRAPNRALSASEGSGTSDHPDPHSRAKAAARDQTTQLVGRTPGDIMVIFDGTPDNIGAIVTVRVESTSPHTLFGRVTKIVSPARVAARR